MLDLLAAAKGAVRATMANDPLFNYLKLLAD
jgi:hypothetical protein